MAVNKVLHTCPVCGSEFHEYLSNGRVFCSKKCSYSPQGRRVGTHRMSKTRLYVVWLDMKNRCHAGSKETTPLAYEYYRQRGITVCQEWRESFEAFCDWAVEAGYKPNLEIDRRDPNGNYCPENCRWATRSQQMRNQRKRRDGLTSKYKGVTKLKYKWRVQISINGRNTHVGVYGTEDEAARAYDAKAFELSGEFALLNFPEAFVLSELAGS